MRIAHHRRSDSDVGQQEEGGRIVQIVTAESRHRL